MVSAIPATNLSIGAVAELADRPPDNARHYREIQRWTRALSARSYELARSGAIPIFLGGDHTLSMGSVNGIARHNAEGGATRAAPGSVNTIRKPAAAASSRM